MNKSKKRLLSCLLLTINLGIGVSNAQPKDANTSNISSEKSKRSLKTSDILTVRNSIDVLGLLAMIYGGRKLLNEIDKNKKSRSDDDSLKKNYESLVKNHESLNSDYDVLKKKYNLLKNNYDVSENNYKMQVCYRNALEKKYDSLQKAHNSCGPLKIEVNALKSHTVREMQKFDLLNTFQNLFRFCHSQGWKCENYIEELAEKDFGDYDVISFNTAEYGHGYANMSAYFVAKGKVNKQLLSLADGEFSKLTSVYDYFRNFGGDFTYSLENGTKNNLFRMIDGEGLDGKKVKEKRVFLVSFEDLFKKVKDPKSYLDGSIKFKKDKEKFKNYYIICEAYRVPGPSWDGEYDDVYYKFLLVEKNKKGIEKEKEIKAKEKKMKEESEISDSDSDSD